MNRRCSARAGSSVVIDRPGATCEGHDQYKAGGGSVAHEPGSDASVFNSRRQWLLLDFFLGDYSRACALLNNKGGGLYAHYGYVRGESIAVSGNRLDIPISTGSLAESLSQIRYVSS